MLICLMITLQSSIGRLHQEYNRGDLYFQMLIMVEANIYDNLRNIRPIKRLGKTKFIFCN